MEMKTPIKNIFQVNTETQEGRLLYAAIGKIQRHGGKPIEEIIENLNTLANKIFENDNNCGNTEKRFTGAKLETPLRGTDVTRETGNPDLGD